MQVTNLLLWVQENRLSEKFYKKLGFNVKESDDSYSCMVLKGFEILLVNIRDGEFFDGDSMAAKKGLGMYIYLRVDDLDDQFKKLVKAGFKPHTQPKDWSWGNREFILKDPDGYKLCFWQPSTKSD